MWSVPLYRPKNTYNQPSSFLFVVCRSGANFILVVVRFLLLISLIAAMTMVVSVSDKTASLTIAATAVETERLVG